MTNLNNYQLAVLHKGAQEELENGVQIHAYPLNETKGLLEKYKALTKKGISASEELEIVVDALISLFDFWGAYFALGATLAFSLKYENDEKQQERLEALCAIYERKYIEELEVM